MKIAVLGAGAWGTALAVHAAPRHEVLLWARDVAQAEAMAAGRCNARYLPEIAFPPALQVSATLDAALAHGAGEGLFVVATPMAGLSLTLAALPQGAAVVWLCKGFEQGSLRLGHEVARALRPDLAVAVLSGPSFAQEVARGLPTAVVAASAHEPLRRRLATAFHADSLRVYTSADVAGVEVGGALKNVLAIATGVADGMSLGLNARAALVTRGLAEMTRLGVALGADAATFMGLSGLGDLVLTTTGNLSRNRQVGLALARGDTLSAILARLGHVAEGVLTADAADARAQALGVDLPITRCVVELLAGRLAPREAVATLLAREPVPER